MKIQIFLKIADFSIDLIRTWAIFETQIKLYLLLIIVDKRIPEPVLEALRKYGDVLLLETSGITYPAISGHPDIFFCRTESKLVIAPNTPNEIKEQLTNSTISFIEGKQIVGAEYPQTAIYNALATSRFLFHNLNYTDQVILSLCDQLEKIDLKQAYTRCSVLALKNDRFITSDKGIEKALLKRGLVVLFVNPKGILLPGFDHGFFGGTCGIYEDKIFFIGSLDHFPEGEKVRNFLFDYEIIELYDGLLFDGGSLILLA